MFDELFEAIKAFCKWVFGFMAACLNGLRATHDPKVNFILSHVPKGLYVVEGTLPKGTKCMLATMTFEDCKECLQAILPAVGVVN